MSSVGRKLARVWTPAPVEDELLTAILSLSGLLKQPRMGTQLRVPEVDPKLHEVMGYGVIDADLIAGLKSEKLKQHCEVFRINCERAYGSIGLLVSIAHHSGQLELRNAITRMALGLEADDVSKDYTTEFSAASSAVGKRWVAKRAVLGDDGINKLVGDNGFDLLDIQVQTGLTLLREKGREVGPVLTGMQSVLGSILLAGYAAYEAFVGDIWIAALDEKPELAVPFLKGNKEKQIKLEALAGYGFDLSKIMGTFLTKRGGGVTFQKLDNILDAYELVFGNSVQSCFEPRNEIRLTEKLRHLLAHRGGLVDEQFLKEIAFDAFYGQLSVGVRVPFTGANVRRHMDACCNSAIELVEFVDNEIAK